jgi:hypothetical protein
MTTLFRLVFAFSKEMTPLSPLLCRSACRLLGRGEDAFSIAEAALSVGFSQQMTPLYRLLCQL